MRTVTVVGASLAGLSAARALREHGYDGRIQIVGAERHRPYDRPPLSKEFLAGAVAAADLALESAGDDALDLHWRLGRSAVRLDPADRAVVLDTGERLGQRWRGRRHGREGQATPGAMACGRAHAAHPRRRPRTACRAAPRRPASGHRCRVYRCGGRLHRPSPWRGGHRRGGHPHPPRRAWNRLGAVRGLARWQRRVVATGDCAVAPSGYAGTLLRAGHWTHAQQHPAVAAATLLGRDHRPPPLANVPYFWSDQYGVRLQFAGHRQAGDAVEVTEGDLDSRRFVAVYRRGGRPVAVLVMNQPKTFARWRRELARPHVTALA